MAEVAAPLILIVGMHRSGTSLLGSLLPACGITMPGPLIQGDHHNPEGYFERSDVTALQEQLLIDLERWWPSPRGMQPLPAGWLEQPRGQRALDELSAILHLERHRQNGPWAIKDPRSSLLLPLWTTACQRLGIPLRLLLAVRDPAEVIVSLVQRDQAYTGMDSWRAQRLWWHHNAEVLRQAGDLPLQVVSYSHWFDRAHALRQLAQLNPEATACQQEQALQAVKPQHRRSQRRLPQRPASAVRRMRRRLEQAALNPTSANALRAWLQRQRPLAGQPPRLLPRIHRDTASTHPWRYLAEIRCGSEPSAIRHQLRQWSSCGFSEDDLRHMAALPVTAPEAKPADQAEAHLNRNDLRPGPACAADLLRLASLNRVWDTDRQRVGMLRQLGIQASWLRT